MAKMIQIPYDNHIVLPVATAQAVQETNDNPISLEALGLLVNLLSYPSTWELHKTELYKRFANHGERSVKSAWNSLVNANYIIEFRYRSGKKYEYVYYFRKAPFTEEEKAEILANAEKEYGQIWGLQNEDPKMETSKRRDNKKTLLNKKPLLNTNNTYIDNIDDDKRTEASPSKHNEEELNMIISNFREATKDVLGLRSFKAVVHKVVDKYNQGKINSFRDYLATALANKVADLEFRKAKEQAQENIRLLNKQERIQQHKQRIEESESTTKKVPFYNWLEMSEE